jgi:endonuclease YncB( thermonuclease family)
LNSSNAFALIRRFLLAAILAAALPTAGAADTLTGRVVAIQDGDTLTLLDGYKQQHRIRLFGIDAPESGQPFRERSRQNLAALAFQREARLDCPTIDHYGRKVCRVLVDGKDVNAEQLEAGMAWWFRRYASGQAPQERLLYESLEDRARADGTGLWADKDPVPPWEWRRAHKSKGNSR